jgi:hypothetical protein
MTEVADCTTACSAVKPPERVFLFALRLLKIHRKILREKPQMFLVGPCKFFFLCVLRGVEKLFGAPRRIALQFGSCQKYRNSSSKNAKGKFGSADVTFGCRKFSKQFRKRANFARYFCNFLRNTLRRAQF